MSIAGVFTSVINLIFSALQVILGIAIIAAPLIMLKKPPESTKKLLMLLSIAAAGILVLFSVAGTVSQIIALSSAGVMNTTNLLSMVASFALSVLGTILTLAFPFIANLLKKETPLVGILLALPVIQSIAVVVNSATGMRLTIGMDMPAIIPGVICGLVLAAVLILAAVWYLTGQKRILSLVLVIAAPIAFIICFILSTAASSTYMLMLAASSSVLSYFSFSTQFFSGAIRMLLLLLTAMGIRALSQPKLTAPVPPVYPGPYYPQN